MYFLFVCLFVISKGEIYTSKVKYFLNKGKPYIWVPEKDFHNVVCCNLFSSVYQFFFSFFPAVNEHLVPAFEFGSCF